MKGSTALTAKPMTHAERKACLAKYVAQGIISPEWAKLILFHKPTKRDREIAKSLVPLAVAALAGNARVRAAK